MNRGHLGGWVCFLGAFALIALAGWNAYTIVEPAVRWKHAQAVPEGTRVGFKHDGEGMLVYHIQTQLSYEAAGRRVTTEAGSNFATDEFFDAKDRAQKFATSPSVPVYWNPSKPTDVRFDLAYDELAGVGVAMPAVAAFLVAGFGWRLRKHWAPASRCTRCNLRVRRYYNFCPHCRTSLYAPDISTTSANPPTTME